MFKLIVASCPVIGLSSQRLIQIAVSLRVLCQDDPLLFRQALPYASGHGAQSGICIIECLGFILVEKSIYLRLADIWQGERLDDLFRVAPCLLHLAFLLLGDCE